MGDGVAPEGSKLFLVRLWQAGEDGDMNSSVNVNVDSDAANWRGRVTHVMSGTAHSFTNWTELIDLLIAPPLQVGREAGGAEEPDARTEQPS